jgi:hypothetical protein
MRPAAPLAILLAILPVNACIRHPVYGAPEDPARPLSDGAQRPSDGPLPVLKPPTTTPAPPHAANQPRSPDAHVQKRQPGRR